MGYVSDHAVLRYLERHHGIDVERIRRELTVPAIDVAAAFGCDRVILPSGERLALHGDVVSTCLPKPKKPKCKRGKGNR